jgi:alkylation response protein AidB-like acyl-CoA dehydrogenase
VRLASTEPDAGSDIKSIKTSIKRNGNKYLLTGSKIYITNGTIASVFVVAAKNENGNLTLSVIDKKTPNFIQRKMHDKLGCRGSDTASLYFDNCEIDESNILGEYDKGREYLNWILQNGRLTISAMSIGLAEAAFSKALDWATKRQQFNTAIANFQAIRNYLSDMETKITASRLLLYNACMRKEKNLPFRKESAMAKLFSSETAVEVTAQAIQILGGYGVLSEYEVERLYRDAKITEIGEGTSEIQRNIISIEILREINFL